MAYHDALTSCRTASCSAGVVVRRFCAQRTGGGCAVLYMSPGKFRPVNDADGHAVRDKLLQQVARRMRKCIGADDTVRGSVGMNS